MVGRVRAGGCREYDEERDQRMVGRVEQEQLWRKEDGRRKLVEDRRWPLPRVKGV